MYFKKIGLFFVTRSCAGSDLPRVDSYTPGGVQKSVHGQALRLRPGASVPLPGSSSCCLLSPAWTSNISRTIQTQMLLRIHQTPSWRDMWAARGTRRSCSSTRAWCTRATRGGDWFLQAVYKLKRIRFFFFPYCTVGSQSFFPCRLFSFMNKGGRS